MSGGTYLLGGLLFLLFASALLVVWPNVFWPALNMVLGGGLVLGLIGFGLIFVLVSIEDLKNPTMDEQTMTESKEELKPAGRKKK